MERTPIKARRKSSVAARKRTPSKAVTPVRSPERMARKSLRREEEERLPIKMRKSMQRVETVAEAVAEKEKGAYQFEMDDRWGFSENEFWPVSFESEKPDNDPNLEEEWEFLAKTLKDEGVTEARKPRLRSLLSLGVPPSKKQLVWRFLLRGNRAGTEGLFADLSQRIDASDEKCKEIVNQIRLDLPRTFPGHSLIGSEKGQKILFSVLNAYANYDLDIRYCQGMASLAAVLAMFYEPEECFWMLVSLIQDRDIAGFYANGMPKLLEECELFEELLGVVCPELASHLHEEGVISILFVVPWFIPLFANLNNFNLVLRIWDLFMFEGVTALRRVGLALLMINKGLYMSLQSSDLIPKIINPPIKDISANKIIAMAMSLDMDDVVARARGSRANLEAAQKGYEQACQAPFPKTKRPPRTPKEKQESWLHRALFGRKNKKDETPRKERRRKTPMRRAAQKALQNNPLVDMYGTPIAEKADRANILQMNARQRPVSSPVRYADKLWVVTPHSPINPVMTELKSFSDMRDLSSEDELEIDNSV